MFLCLFAYQQAVHSGARGKQYRSGWSVRALVIFDLYLYHKWPLSLCHTPSAMPLSDLPSCSCSPSQHLWYWTRMGNWHQTASQSFHLPIATGRNMFHRDLIIWPHVHDRGLSMFKLNCFSWSLHRSAQPVTILSLSFASQPLCPQFIFPFHMLARLFLSSSLPSSASQVLFLPLCI